MLRLPSQSAPGLDEGRVSGLGWEHKGLDLIEQQIIKTLHSLFIPDFILIPFQSADTQPVLQAIKQVDDLHGAILTSAPMQPCGLRLPQFIVVSFYCSLKGN